MIAIIECGRSAKVRFWVGELPFRLQTFADQSCVPASAKLSSTERKSVALELCWPTGGRILYGLLGGDFAPSSDNEFTVEICGEDDRTFESTLVRLADDVRQGLASEYRRSVLSVILNSTSAIEHLGSGKLQINCAAHGRFGSAIAVFKALAVTLVDVLAREDSIPGDQLCEIVRANLRL